jgi:hypothetical protein
MIWHSLQKGADHSRLVIAFIVFCLGGYVTWKHRQAFSAENVLYTGVIGVAILGFVLCLIGGIGFFTGYIESKYSAPIPISRMQALRGILAGLGMIGILVLEICLPYADYYVRKVFGRESENVSWSSF